MAFECKPSNSLPSLGEEAVQLQHSQPRPQTRDAGGVFGSDLSGLGFRVFCVSGFRSLDGAFSVWGLEIGTSGFRDYCRTRNFAGLRL